MNEHFNEIQDLLHQKADFQARLNLLPYDGTPEIKNINGKRYLYTKKRVAGKPVSEYAGDELESRQRNIPRRPH